MKVKRYLPGGRLRGLWDDRSAGQLRDHGAVPKRASQVFVVEHGPRRGRFAVDFSPLGEGYAFCLAVTFARYDEAVAAEQRWLTGNYVLAPEAP